MKITFVLPGARLTPSGGFKVVFEYANRFVSLGHQVSLILPSMGFIDPSAVRWLVASIKYWHRRVLRNFRPDSWFPLDLRVRVLWVPNLAEKFVPDGDVVIATAWQTAEWVDGFGKEKGEKFYLIQSLETWNGPEDRVLATWHSSLKKIVISRWLQEVAYGLGVHADYVPNGLSKEEFGIDLSLEERNPARAMMLWHTAPVKGSQDGMVAFREVKKKCADLQVTLFGVSRPPKDLPSWVSYYQRPSPFKLRRLYNEASVFVSPSHIEGWALPPAEAMLCGSALVATDIGGHRDYASPEETALLSASGDSQSMADNILNLIQNHDLRLRLAKAGHDVVKGFDWEKSVTSLSKVLATGLSSVKTRHEDR